MSMSMSMSLADDCLMSNKGAQPLRTVFAVLVWIVL